MTMKQLESAIKSTRKNLDTEKRNMGKAQNEGARRYYEQAVDHYEKLLSKYMEMLPLTIEAEKKKELKKTAKQQIKDKATEIKYIEHGSYLEGVTPNGNRWVADHNWDGMTERTMHCYALRINGETMFTSGTLDTVLETVAQN